MYLKKEKVCYHCKEEMVLTENDILYGKDWYHKTCWDVNQERSINNT